MAESGGSLALSWHCPDHSTQNACPVAAGAWALAATPSTPPSLFSEPHAVPRPGPADLLSLGETKPETVSPLKGNFVCREENDREEVAYVLVCVCGCIARGASEGGLSAPAAFAAWITGE